MNSIEGELLITNVHVIAKKKDLSTPNTLTVFTSHVRNCLLYIKIEFMTLSVFSITSMSISVILIISHSIFQYDQRISTVNMLTQYKVLSVSVIIVLIVMIYDHCDVVKHERFLFHALEYES